ncbi:MAG: N-acetyl sugar amidotransferase, partial [Dehalococcoidia bacterium]
MSDRPYQICVRCVMDTTDPDIEFDAEGVCNHCRWYDANLERRIILDPLERERALNDYVARIKADGRGKQYDCIIGVSGGVDSTYVAYLTKKLGLRPLAVHLDNGWNSGLAVKNIERVLRKLDIDLFTEVLDWEEFRELQRSFLYASTPDGEVPTDHAIYAVLMREAKRNGLRYIVNGRNFQTEGSRVVKWAYGHTDWRYIRGVHRRFGSVRLRTYPHYTLPQLAWATFARRLRFLSILNYIDYQKEEAMSVLQNDLGWVYYGGKHYESIYTRFYQAYVLPEKFNIDKRRMHESDLIRSGQTTRAVAL